MEPDSTRQPPGERTVPVSERARSAERPALAGTAEPALLIVEDDRNSREGLRDLLVRAGFRVEVAADGIQAIRKVKDGSFAGAIIDLDLPPIHGLVIDGWDVGRICRAFSQGIALLFVSAEGGADVRARAQAFSRCEFIEKPIDPARLRAALGRLGPWGDEERGSGHA